MLGASWARKGDVLQKLNRDKDAKAALSKAGELGYKLTHGFGLAIAHDRSLVKDSGYEEGLGFEVAFALASLFAVCYLYRRKGS